MGAEFVRRVLIADADAAVRQQLFSALLDQDIFSDCVLTVVDALEKLAEQKYGVVILDVALPGADVGTVIDRMAAIPAVERPVVLILAARPEATRSLDVEIVQIVLRKPVVLAQIVDLVSSCLKSVERTVTERELRKGSSDQLTS
ncbi:MAG TPA: response regulator [Thermoanaerobaculia bacterium]|nr:response regulator [Thermoanaerobaculia bacterium]